MHPLLRIADDDMIPKLEHSNHSASFGVEGCLSCAISTSGKAFRRNALKALFRLAEQTFTSKQKEALFVQLQEVVKSKNADEAFHQLKEDIIASNLAPILCSTLDDFMEIVVTQLNLRSRQDYIFFTVLCDVLVGLSEGLKGTQKLLWATLLQRSQCIEMICKMLSAHDHPPVQIFAISYLQQYYQSGIIPTKKFLELVFKGFARYFKYTPEQKESLIKSFVQTRPSVARLFGNKPITTLLEKWCESIEIALCCMEGMVHNSGGMISQDECLEILKLTKDLNLIRGVMDIADETVSYRSISLNTKAPEYARTVLLLLFDPPHMPVTQCYEMSYSEQREMAASMAALHFLNEDPTYFTKLRRLYRKTRKETTDTLTESMRKMRLKPLESERTDEVVKLRRQVASETLICIYKLVLSGLHSAELFALSGQHLLSWFPHLYADLTPPSEDECDKLLASDWSVQVVKSSPITNNTYTDHKSRLYVPEMTLLAPTIYIGLLKLLIEPKIYKLLTGTNQALIAKEPLFQSSSASEIENFKRMVTIPYIQAAMKRSIIAFIQVRPHMEVTGAENRVGRWLGFVELGNMMMDLAKHLISLELEHGFNPEHIILINSSLVYAQHCRDLVCYAIEYQASSAWKWDEKAEPDRALKIVKEVQRRLKEHFGNVSSDVKEKMDDINHRLIPIWNETLRTSKLTPY